MSRGGRVDDRRGPRLGIGRRRIEDHAAGHHQPATGTECYNCRSQERPGPHPSHFGQT
jgi:hypothetical protein